MMMVVSRTIRLPFNEAKAAQAAARLLSNNGGRMNYMKLIKLLYLIDREALNRWGRPVSTDRYVSMDHGPVLSSILDLINHGAEPGTKSPWMELISAPEKYDVRLRSAEPPADDELSKAEEELIDEIFTRFRTTGQWDVVDYLHRTVDEWEQPQGSSNPINYEDIFKALGKSGAEVSALEEELESVSSIDRLCV